jgi:hypothetical protein
MTTYRVALPHPWVHIPLGNGTQERVAEIVQGATDRIPDDVPPDQVAQARIRLEGMLLAELKEAQENGAIDYYVPTDTMHGVTINASFVVSAVIPDAAVEDGATGAVLASLLKDGDSRPVTVADTVWVRTEEVMERPADDVVGEDVSARKVDYVTAVPSEQRRWIIVSFTTVGDGDPNSEFTALMVELFDAIMSTWRWQEDE